MVAFILPANSVTGGYDIDNSLRFGVDTDLKRLPSATGQSIKGTLSVWVKFATADTEMAIIGGFDNSGANDNDGYFVFKRLADGNLQFEGGDNVYLETTALFRDTSAWYHIVLAIDSGNSTANNKQRIYVNGAEITAFDTRNNLGNLQDLPMNTTAGNDDALLIGCDEDTGGKGLFFNGYMSEFYWIDQNQYAASDFGEYNDDGIWIPKAFAGSFGVNGVFLQFKQTGTDADASGIGADTGGSTLHFTATNLAATDVTTDTPTNNFATLNPLNNFQGGVLSQGNTSLVTPSSSTTPANLNGIVPATIGVANGKWYWEVNVTTTNYVAVGIMPSSSSHITYLTPSGSGTRIVKGDDGIKFSSNSSGGNYMAAYEGLILQVALDMDNGTITFGAGGSWANGSGATNQTFGNATAAYTDIISSGDYAGEFALPTFSDENQGTSDTFQVNFGNPLFAISSSNADANGYGNFEYAVPSGYYALCTKNLAEYG